MTLHVNDGGTWKSAVPYVNDAGTWTVVREVWVNDAGTWKQAFISISCTIAPTSQNSAAAASTWTYSPCTVTVIGGTPTSFSWGFTGITGGSFSVSAGQSTATATPRVTGVAASVTASARFVCTVVVAGEAYTASIPISHFNTSSGV